MLLLLLLLLLWLVLLVLLMFRLLLRVLWFARCEILDDWEFSCCVDRVYDAAAIFLLHAGKKRGALVRLTAIAHRTHVHSGFVWVVGDGRTKGAVGEHGQERHSCVHGRKKLTWNDGVFSMAEFA